MSIYTSLDHPLLDVTAKVRGRVDTRPIRVGHDLDTKDVVVILEPAYAEKLAGVLAQLGSNPDRVRDPDQLAGVLTVDHEQQDAWMHAVVDVLASVAMATNESIPVTPITRPRLRSTRR